MQLTNPFTTIINFLKLVVSRYLDINLMGEKIEDIFNYLKINDNLATGGQPTEKQLFLIKQADYKVVINLALPTSENALPDERKTVEALGMKYLNIPIDFKQPTIPEFELFAQAMENNQDQSVFIHCAANLRVSAFIYLYRQLYLNISKEEAKKDLEKIWTPNPTWQKLINFILENQEPLKTNY